MLDFAEGGKRENPEKNPRSKGENQQQTKPTYDAGSGNRHWWDTLVGGERSHHCATPAPALIWQLTYAHYLRLLWLLIALCSKQKYSQEEIDAAYALLALSNSTSAASPPDYQTTVNKSEAKHQSAKCSRDNQFSLLSQAPPEQRHLQTSRRIPELIPASQVSPLVELNTFVAATLPVREERYVYNPLYHVSQPVSFLGW